MTSLVSAIEQALEIPHVRSSVDAVHQTVINGLRELDPSIKLRKTGYFNHSWAPDMIASWDGVPDSRHVYLRFNAFHPALAEERERLRQDAPIILSLLQRRGQTSVGPQDEAGFADGRSPLLTEAEAVDRFATAIEDASDTRRATREIVRGGVGVVDRPVAERIIGSYRSVVTSVRERLDVDELRSALNLIEKSLDDEAALRLERALRSDWIAAGGDAATFPGRESWDLATSSVDELMDLVESLLEHDAFVSPDMWREIARHTTADAVGLEMRRRRFRRGGRFNDFASAAADVWAAEWVHTPPLPSEPFIGEYDWFTGNYGLAFQFADREVYFSDDGRRFSQVRDTFEMPFISERLEYLDDPGVGAVSLITWEESVAISLRETASHSIKQLIEDLFMQESATWQHARLSKLTVRLPALTAEVQIDYRRATAYADRPVPLSTYLELIGRYVAGLGAAALEELRRRLAG